MERCCDARMCESQIYQSSQAPTNSQSCVFLNPSQQDGAGVLESLENFALLVIRGLRIGSVATTAANAAHLPQPTFNILADLRLVITISFNSDSTVELPAFDRGVSVGPEVFALVHNLEELLPLLPDEAVGIEQKQDAVADGACAEIVAAGSKRSAAYVLPIAEGRPSASASHDTAMKKPAKFQVGYLDVPESR
jgi:hypothetical protein